MQAVWTNVGPLVGVIVGVFLTSLWQWLMARAARSDDRRAKQRVELAAAVSTFMSKSVQLQRAELNRAITRINTPSDDRITAQRETYLLRSEALEAYYLIRVFSQLDVDDGLAQGAKEILGLLHAITADTRDIAEVQARNEAADKALGRFVDDVRQRLREGALR